MNKRKVEEVLANLKPEEVEILGKILEAEKEVLHKKSLQGTHIKRTVYSIIKSGVKEA